MIQRLDFDDIAESNPKPFPAAVERQEQSRGLLHFDRRATAQQLGPLGQLQRQCGRIARLLVTGLELFHARAQTLPHGGGIADWRLPIADLNLAV